MTDTSRLDGATEPGPLNVEATPEQFAARWNERTPEERAQWLAHMRENSRRGMDCWLQQHERIDEYQAAIGRVLRLCLERDAHVAAGPTGFFGEPMAARVSVEEVRAAIEGRR